MEKWINIYYSCDIMGHYGIPMKHGYGPWDITWYYGIFFLWEYIWQNNASRIYFLYGMSKRENIRQNTASLYLLRCAEETTAYCTWEYMWEYVYIHIMQYYTTFRSSWTYIGNIGCILMGIHLELYLAESIQFTVHINIGNYYMIIYVGENIYYTHVKYYIHGCEKYKYAILGNRYNTIPYYIQNSWTYIGTTLMYIFGNQFGNIYLIYICICINTILHWNFINIYGKLDVGFMGLIM